MGNHSGGNLTPDTLVFTLAFNTYFGVERAFYQLAHNLVLAAPGLRRLRKFGTVATSRQNAQEALDSGAALLVHPGGRPRGPPPLLGAPRVSFGGRKGRIRLALEPDVPIVPVVSVGGQETALFLTCARSSARSPTWTRSTTMCCASCRMLILAGSAEIGGLIEIVE